MADTTASTQPATDQAIATLQAAPAELFAIQKEASAAHEAARGWKPAFAEREEYTPAGIRAEQDRRRGDVADRVKQQLDAIEQGLQQGAETIAQYMSGAGRPGQSDSAAETREDRVWNNKLRPLLEANRGPAKVIAEASTLDEVRALQRELPGWLMVRKQQGARDRGDSQLRQAMTDANSDDPAPVLSLIGRKLADLLPPAEGTRLRAALDAEDLTVSVRTRIDALRRQYGTGGNTARANLRDALAGAGATAAAKARRASLAG